MNFTSIRARLTAWYFCSLALVLALFAWASWMAMNASVIAAVDHDLQVRVQDVRTFIGQELSASPDELSDEFREHSLLGLGGGFVEVFDSGGAVLYRSARIGNTQLAYRKPAGGAIEYTMQRAGDSDLRVASQAFQVKARRFVVEVAAPMRAFDESIKRFASILLILAPVFLVLASLGGFWMSTRALAPVDKITEGARRISIANLSARLPTTRAKDEVQRLTQTLNDMLDRIDTAVQRIVQFTADASHELRAPLTLIHIAAEFSLRRERTREELLDAMRKILRESGRTSELVDDLLLLARADSGTHELRRVPTDISGSARNAVEQVLTLAEPKNIHVSTDIPYEPVIVNGDEEALARLWLILLDNAVKYTEQGGRVSFAIRAVNSHAEATVSDTGVGIAPADLPHVFDRFWRADKVRSRSMGGAGLGLSIGRWIVQRHGGEIEVRSELGRGSQVTVRLPSANR